MYISGYLYSFGKIAGQTVASTATKLKHTVEEKVNIHIKHAHVDLYTLWIT